MVPMSILFLSITWNQPWKYGIFVACERIRWLGWLENSKKRYNRISYEVYFYLDDGTFKYNAEFEQYSDKRTWREPYPYTSEKAEDNWQVVSFEPLELAHFEDEMYFLRVNITLIDSTNSSDSSSDESDRSSDSEYGFFGTSEEYSESSNEEDDDDDEPPLSSPTSKRRRL